MRNEFVTVTIFTMGIAVGYMIRELPKLELKNISKDLK